MKTPRTSAVSRLTLTALVAAALLGSHSMQAATYDWNQTITPLNWSTAANWNTSVPPSGGPSGAGDVVNINTNITADAVINLAITADGFTAAKTIGILNIGDLTLASNKFTLQAGTGTGSLVMNNSGAGAQINELSGAKGDVISAAIQTADAGGLTISNASATTFVVSGAITSDTTGRNLVFKANAAGALTISGSSVNNQGTITNSGSGTGTTTITTVGSNVTALTQNSTTSALTVTTLNVNGSGTTLTNTAGTKQLTVTNSVAGTGNLVLNNNSVLASGISLSGGANNIGSITNSGTNATGTTTITGIIGTNVNGGVIQNGAGTLNMNGLNTFTSGLTVTKGTVTSSQAGATGFGNGAISLGNTAGGNSDNAAILYTGASVLVANTITVNAGSSGILSIQGNTAATNAFTGTIALNNALTLANLTAAKITTFSGTITGSSAINIGNTGITNAGIVAITGSNGSSYTGNTTVNGGTLNFGSGGLGNGSGTITLAGGTLQYAAAANTQDIGSRLRTSGANALKIDVNNNAVVFASPLTDASLTQGLTVTSSTAGGSLTLTGANTYTGLTTVTSGTLKLGSSSTIASGNALTTGASGTFDLNGNDQTIGTLINGGNITNSGVTTKTLTFGSATTSTSNLGSFTGAMNVIVNSGNTTTLSGSWSNAGNITLNNTVGSTLSLNTGTINNTGSITNSGSGAGATNISANIGANVGLITESSAGGSALTLSGTNTNAAGVTLTAGKLILGSTTALGATASTLTIGSGTTLDSTVANLVLANNNALNLNGSFTFTGTQSLDLGTGAVTIAAPLTLTVTSSTKTLTFGGAISGGTIFDITKAGAGTLEYTRNVTLSGTQVISTITAGTETFSGILSGSGASLTMASAGTLKLANANTYTGATTLTSGTLSLSGANGSVASPSGVTASAGATLAFDSSTAGVAGTTRVSSVMLKGAALTVTGNSTVNSVDTITGALTIDYPSSSATTGGNSVTLTPNAATNTQLTAGSLVRANNAVVLFRGTNLGTTAIASPAANTSNIVFTSAPTAQLVGGGGAAGSKNISIIPWAVGDTSATGTGSSFVTYDANGIRPLTAGEYDTSLPAGASTNNVSLALAAGTTTFDGATTVNSLFLTTTGAGSILAGTGSITVTSGAVYANFGSNGMTITKQLDFGSVRGIIGTSNNQFNSLSINGGISGSNGVIFYGTPTTNTGNNILLSGANGPTSYTGDTIILGNLKVSATTGVAILPNGSAGRSGDVYVYGTFGIGSNTNGSGYALQINGLNGTGNVVEGGSNATTFIVGDNNANGDFSGGLMAGNGSFSFTKIGTGTQILSGTTSTRNIGSNNIQNGTLSVVTLNSVIGGTAASSLGAPSSASNGIINLGSLTTTGQLTVVGTGETTDRTMSLAGRTGGGTIDQSGTGLLKFTGSFIAPGANATDERKTLTLQGSTAGTGEISGVVMDSTLGTAGQKATSVTKAGTGTWTVSGANIYTGATTVNEGTLIVTGSTGSISSTGQTGSTTNNSLTVTGLNTVGLSPGQSVTGTGVTGVIAAIIDSTTISLSVNATTTSATNSLTFGAISYAGAGTGAMTIGAAGTLQLGNGSTTGSLSTSSAIANDGNLTIKRSNAVAQGTDFSSAAITGTGSFTQAGTGTTTLTASNTYTGDTTVINGTLALSGSGTFGSGSLTVSGGTADLGTASITNTLGALTGGAVNNGTITNNSGTYDLRNGSVGAILAGTNALTKSTGSTVTLNAANGYSGNTTISAGTLALGVSGTFANSPVINLGTAGSQGILDLTTKPSFAFGTGQTLSGYGAINIGTGKLLTFASGSILAPGNSPGIVNVTGDVALASGSTTNMDIFSRNAGSPVAGADFDRLIASGTLAFGGTLNIDTTGLSGLVAGDSFGLFTAAFYTPGFTSVAMTGAYASAFANSSGIWTGHNAGLDFTFTEADGFLTISVAAIPEPSTYALLGGFGTLLFALGYRRRARRAANA